MTSYSLSVLTDGGYRFLCPYIGPLTTNKCNYEWEYFLVRHVACLSDEDMQSFETRICENYVRRSNGIQKCPGCQVFCMRQDCKNNRVRCILCTKEKGKAFEFCWSCLHEWKIGSSKCSNPECDGIDPRIRYLRNCPQTTINGVTCPSLRGCPKCGILIQHTQGCKHMICKCTHNFCFVCLEPKKDGKYPCGSYRDPCSVAPIQTAIPGAN